MTFIVPRMHSCVNPLFSSGRESSVCLDISRLCDACYNTRFVDVALLRTILSSCVTVAGEAYKLFARRAHEYNGTSSSSFYVPVTAFSYSWHQRPHPLQYLSQFQISLNIIKQRHPQARASVTLNCMTNFTYNTLWNPPKRSTNQPHPEPQQIWKWFRNAPDMLIIDQLTSYVWEKEVVWMWRTL